MGVKVPQPLPERFKKPGGKVVRPEPPPPPPAKKTMSEEKKQSDNQTEKYLLKESFEKFLRNDHFHLAEDVRYIKGKVEGMEGTIGLIARTSEKALDTAIKRYPTWVTFVLTLFSSLIVGMVVWITSN